MMEMMMTVKHPAAAAARFHVDCCYMKCLSNLDKDQAITHNCSMEKLTKISALWEATHIISTEPTTSTTII